MSKKRRKKPVPQPEASAVAPSQTAPQTGPKYRARAHGYSRNGASFIKRALQGWLAPAGSPDDDIVANLATLRERSRDLYMGSPLATAAIKTLTTSVVGPGLRLNAQADAEALGLTDKAARVWERAVEREFALWANSEDCDAARSNNFGELQRIAFMSALMSGDCFVTLPVIPRPGQVYDLKINLIEGDCICDPTPCPVNKDIYEGVEVDRWGAPVAYYVTKYHPATFAHKVLSDGVQQWKRTPAFGPQTGRRQVLHLMPVIERPGQRRGTPLLAPAMEALKQMGRYTEAELMAAVIASMYTVFIKTSTPDAMLGSGIPGGMLLPENEDDDTAYELGSGSIVGLREGESIDIANPSRPYTGFNAFVDAMAKQVGAALEIPWEILTKCFNTSYTAARAAMVESGKMYDARRSWLASTFCRPIYEDWLAEAVAKGRIQAPGFFEDPSIRAAWSGSDWIGAAQGSLDPTKDVQAAEMRVAASLSTREREAAESTGMRLDRILRVQAREEAARREAGLVHDQNGVPITELPPAADEAEEVNDEQ